MKKYLRKTYEKCLTILIWRSYKTTTVGAQKGNRNAVV